MAPVTPPSRDLDPSALGIRDARAADAEPLGRLLGRGFEVAEPPSDALDPYSRAWIAELAGDDDPIGVVGLRMVQDHAAEIHDLWVCPERRGHGVGVRLMETCLGYCRDHGVLKTLLHAEGDQTAAINLFQKVGFLLARQRPAGKGERLEFYMDLYRDEPGESSGGA